MTTETNNAVSFLNLTPHPVVIFSPEAGNAINNAAAAVGAALRAYEKSGGDPVKLYEVDAARGAFDAAKAANPALLVVPPTAPAARCDQKPESRPALLGVGGVEIVVSESTFGAVQDLPAPQAGVVYIVSGLVLSRPEVQTRSDVFAPGAAVRDPEGRVIGAIGLSATPAYPAPAPSGDDPSDSDPVWADAPETPVCGEAPWPGQAVHSAAIFGFRESGLPIAAAYLNGGAEAADELYRGGTSYSRLISAPVEVLKEMLSVGLSLRVSPETARALGFVVPATLACPHNPKAPAPEAARMTLNLPDEGQTEIVITGTPVIDKGGEWDWDSRESYCWKPESATLPVVQVDIVPGKSNSYKKAEFDAYVNSPYYHTGDNDRSRD